MRRFPARWDRSLQLSTVVFGVVLVGACVGSALLLGDRPGVPGLLAALLPLVLLATGAGAWALAPKAFALQGSELLVERNLWRPLRLALADVREVAVLPDGALRRAVKLVGTAGLFGHYGTFRTGALGSFRLYATRRGGALVAVRTGSNLYVLSPEPAEVFAEAVLAAAPSARRAGPAALEPAPGSRRRTTLIAAAVLATAALALGGTAWWAWSRGPATIAVAGDAIVIERRQGPPVEIPLAAVRSVEVLGREQLLGLRRNNGTSGFGVLYGHFSTAVLGDFQLYAIVRHPVWVRIVTEGGPIPGPVVLTPDEPGAFLARVRAALPPARPAVP